MTSTTYRTLAVSAATLALLLPIGATAAPQPKAVGQGFELSQPLIELGLDPGQAKTVTIGLRNTSGVNMRVAAEANDFIAQGDSGQPGILTDGKSAGRTSMKDWFAPVAPFIVAPGQLKQFPVTVTAPRNASPGGHYGALRLSSVTSGLSGESSGVAISANIAPLFLVRVSGDVKERLELVTAFAQKDGKKQTVLQNGSGIKIIERMRNSGNVHVVPTGTLAITNMFGQTVAKTKVNEVGGNVLPDSIRQFEQPLSIGRGFGKYEARMFLTYANGKQFESKFTFWILPFGPIALGLLGLGLLIFFLTRFRLAKR